jgi:hypothetical protein
MIGFLISNIIEEIKLFFNYFSSFFAHWYYRLLISKKRSSLPFSLSTFIPIPLTILSLQVLQSNRVFPPDER